MGKQKIFKIPIFSNRGAEGVEFVWIMIILIVTTVLTFGGIGLLIFHRKRSDEEVKLEIGPDESHS
jgi:Tfp pilus assembly protein PilX